MLNKPSLLILGAGGYGLAVAEAAELSGQWQEIMFADDRWPATQHVAEYNIVANIASLHQLDTMHLQAIVAVGNNALRLQWQQTVLGLGIELTSVIHPHSMISPTAQIGLGVSVMAGCIISRKTVINDGVILNIGTLLDHDVVIEAFAHLSVGVKVAGGQTIAAHSFLEVGTCILH